MKKFEKTLIAFLAAFVFASPLFAASAKVTFVKGKAEILKNNSWIALNIGDNVEMADTISTGFQSEVKLEYGGSIMSLGALTRITLEALSSTSTKENVSVYLKTGSVRSKVTHTEEKRVSYNVKSPVAVCSVRGTTFVMRADGYVNCTEGAVAVYANNSPNYNFASDESSEEAAEEEESEESLQIETVADVPSDDAGSDGEQVAESKPGDYPSATPTTPAKEISSDSPAGAVVVGKNQTVVFKNDGNPQTPLVVATKNTNTIKNTVSTISEKEAVVVGGTSSVVQDKTDIATPDVETADSLEDLQNKIKGNLKATVKFED